MNALYFRHLFQNTARGVVHTVSASGEKGEFCLCSLCSDGRPLEEEAHAGELFRLEKAVITMLLLENLHPEDLKKVGKLLKTNKVERVLIPYGDTAENLPELSKAEKVQILKAGETVVLQEKGWNVWVKCLDHGPKGNLVLYHGPCETSKKGMDCLMAVKPAEAELPCSACVCQEDHTCGMRCCLYNDFILCKGHNGKYDGSYVLGTLLLGNADIKTKEKELREDLKPYLVDLRVISMNESGCSEKVSDSFITDPGRKTDGLTSLYSAREHRRKRRDAENNFKRRTPPDSISDESGSWRMYFRFFEKQIRIIREVSERVPLEVWRRSFLHFFRTKSPSKT